MKHFALAAFIAITMGHGTITYAQESLVGTYTGSFTFSGSGYGPQQVGMQLTIASVENGVVKGTVTVYRGYCSGNHPMEGKYDGNKLAMKGTAKGGPAGDCLFSLIVVQEGNKLVGKTALGSPIQLSK